MKWLFVCLITLSAAFFLWPAEPESQLYAVRGQFSDKCKSLQTSLVLSLKSEQDIEELLYYKKAEQQAYEDALQKVEATIAKMQAEVGICRITGQPNIFTLEEDPRPELQAKIDNLKEEIRLLENNS